MEFRVEKTEKIRGTVQAPPSKSYTHRAFFLSALASGKSTIRNPLYSEDTLASLVACQAFGGQFQVSDEVCLVEGTAGKLQTPEDVLDLKNSGTTLRLATTMAALAPRCTVLTGDDSLRTRPMQPLLEALVKLGVKAWSTRNNGMAPLVIENGFQGGSAIISGDVSSQYISSILISAPYAQDAVELQVRGDFISQPYVAMTLDIMKEFGVKVDYHREEKLFQVNPQTYHSRHYTVEGDYSSASYLIAAAAILDSEVTIRNLFRDSRQGDKIILDIVEEMGVKVNRQEDMVTLEGNGEIRGVEVNLEDAPDLVPTVAVLGALAQGTTTINGVEHARFKETDRISTTAQELKKIGFQVQEKDDGLILEGGVSDKVSGVRVDSHGDHRLAMALSLVGLKLGKIRVQNAEVHNISFPRYREVMEKLGCQIEALK
ncbi:MAG: 3-phosphoshikimate 1-carboxyvinyltransferase [Methanobacteriaceae archaeon]